MQQQQPLSCDDGGAERMNRLTLTTQLERTFLSTAATTTSTLILHTSDEKIEHAPALAHSVSLSHTGRIRPEAIIARGQSQQLQCPWSNSRQRATAVDPKCPPVSEQWPHRRVAADSIDRSCVWRIAFIGLQSPPWPLLPLRAGT